MDKELDIKALVLDVDGTLTDGGIYIGETGEIMKRFHVKDGYAIHNMLPELRIIPIIITGRKSEIVKYRCEELGIKHIVQGSCDKVGDMKRVLDSLNITLSQTAYMGDDLNDYDAMQMVAMKACPNDAAEEIKNISDYITKADGGNGAVREFVEWLKKLKSMKAVW